MPLRFAMADVCQVFASGLTRFLFQAGYATHSAFAQFVGFRGHPNAVVRTPAGRATGSVVAANPQTDPARTGAAVLPTGLRAGVSWADGFRHPANARRRIARPTSQRLGSVATATAFALAVVRADSERGLATAGQPQPASAGVLSRLAVGGLGWDGLRRGEHPADRAGTGQGGEPPVSRGVCPREAHGAGGIGVAQSARG